jgi:tRNA threonylcarbamoyladenosine biosynthesis protein TsaE
MIKEVNSEREMKAFGAAIGNVLHGGEIIELIGDVGSGKTTLVKGIAVQVSK